MVTGLMLLAGLAVVVVPRLLGEEATTYRLAVVGEAPEALTRQLDAAGRAADFQVRVLARSDAAAVEATVRDGDADVGLAGSGQGTTVYVGPDRAGPFPSIVAGAVTAGRTAQALVDAGLTPQQIATVQGTEPPRQVVVGRVDDRARAGVGFAVGIVLYIALLITGIGIATTVATEKATRVSEVLLSVLRPSQLLVGTVVGAGLLSLLQIAALAVPAGGSLLLSHRSDVPASAAPDIALAVLWFLLGLAVYAFVFAALAALVDKVTEVNGAIVPVQMLLIGAYLIAVVVTISSPTSPVSVAASLFPLTSPIVMPVRWASGLVPVWQLVASMVLAVATAVLLARFASLVYRRGVVRTGQRVKLREVLGREHAPSPGLVRPTRGQGSGRV